MNLSKTITILTVAALMYTTADAQQVPMYTHYMYNTLVINPAYAGSRDALTITALHRTQWVNFEGAPSTQTITMHSPLRNKQLGLGLSVMKDKIGPLNSISVVGDFAYIIKVSDKANLALGLSGGVNMVSVDLNTLQLEQQNDPVFTDAIQNKVTPDVGFGAYYSRERFYAGASVPNLLQNNYSNSSNSDGVTLIGKEQRHYFFIAGTVFKLSEGLELKPTTLVKVTESAPMQIDLTGTFIIMKRILIGGMYRSGDAVGALVGFNITPQFNIGYSYDWSYGLSSGTYNQGSHEIMLRYDFLTQGQKQIHNPRYF
jgi:type IX secretion system PorP/SprF family membrane protein